MSSRNKAYVFLLLTTVIWGIASPVIKYTLEFISPFAFLFWRFLLTCLILTPILLVYIKKKKIKLSFSKFIKLGSLGLLGITFSLSLLFVGYNYTTAIDGILISSMSPLIVIIGGGLLLKEEVTRREKTGSLIAFLGTIVTVIQPLLEGQALALQNIKGNFLILLSAIAWAAYCLLIKKVETRDKNDPLVVTSIGFIVGFFSIIPLFLLEAVKLNTPLTLPSLPSLPGIVYMSLFSSIIAFLTYNMGYALIEASEATLFDYLRPVFAAPLAVLWLNEALTLPFLTGAFLITLGVVITEYRKSPIKQLNLAENTL